MGVSVNFGTKYLVLGTKYLVLGTKYLVLGTKYLVLGTKYLDGSTFWSLFGHVGITFS